MFAQDVVERFGHQRLQASALTAGQRVHRERHFWREEAGDLLAALTAGGTGRGPLPAHYLAILNLSDWGLSGIGYLRDDGGRGRCAIA